MAALSSKAVVSVKFHCIFELIKSINLHGLSSVEAPMTKRVSSDVPFHTVFVIFYLLSSLFFLPKPHLSLALPSSLPFF